MTAAQLGRRFLETTRGRVVALLRRGARTVEELAQPLGLTHNAVRNHLATLERDGLVRTDGVRRGPGAGKPAVLYELHPDAESLFSRAYPPVLTAVLDVVLEELPADRAADVLRAVGGASPHRRAGRRRVTSTHECTPRRPCSRRSVARWTSCPRTVRSGSRAGRARSRRP